MRTAARLASQSYRPILWQRCLSNGNLALGGVRFQIVFLFPKLTREREIRIMKQRLNQMEQQAPKKR
jgi:hypothetical protein